MKLYHRKRGVSADAVVCLLTDPLWTELIPNKSHSYTPKTVPVATEKPQRARPECKRANLGATWFNKSASGEGSEFSCRFSSAVVLAARPNFLRPLLWSSQGLSSVGRARRPLIRPVRLKSHLPSKQRERAALSQQQCLEWNNSADLFASLYPLLLCA